MFRPKSRQQKQLPFTKEAIQIKAYELWELRGGERGSPEEDWETAIQLLRDERTVFGRVKHLFHLALKADTPSAALDVIKTGISALGIAATIFAGIGLYLTYQNAQQQQRIAHRQQEIAIEEQRINTERLVTERFTKAVEQLGNQGIDVRIGAIYSLERIAKDSDKDHWAIMEVLTAFVRNRSPISKESSLEGQELPTISTDVQSALTVIGRRDASKDKPPGYLNLKDTNLNRANFTDANLNRANLNRTNLNRANLSRSNLSAAYLNHIFLNGSDLTGVNLSSSDLRGADLRGANLSGTDLTDANLIGANLNGAKNITPAQIKSAKNWQKAYYSPGFRKQLGLPPKPIRTFPIPQPSIKLVP